jgi:hypothetical protein
MRPTIIATALAIASLATARPLRGSGLQPRHDLLAQEGASAPVDNSNPLLWKYVLHAFLRVNDSGVKDWSVFQIKNEHDRFLVQLSGRILFVDASRKRVFDLTPSALERNDSGDILWDPADQPAKPLATSEWIVRDVGLAYRIKMRLNAEGRTLDLQIPHPARRP